MSDEESSYYGIQDIVEGQRLVRRVEEVRLHRITQSCMQVDCECHHDPPSVLIRVLPVK